jgi:hypothetical protein
MLALMGHMSRAMLERYSHIRMAAKRTAVESLAFTPKPKTDEPTAVPTGDADSDGSPTKVPTVGTSSTIQ